MIRKLDENLVKEETIKEMIMPFAKVMEETGVDDFFDEDLPYITNLKEINVKQIIKKLSNVDIDVDFKDFQNKK